MYEGPAERKNGVPKNTYVKNNRGENSSLSFDIYILIDSPGFARGDLRACDFFIQDYQIPLIRPNAPSTRSVINGPNILPVIPLMSKTCPHLHVYTA